MNLNLTLKRPLNDLSAQHQLLRLFFRHVEIAKRHTSVHQRVQKLFFRLATWRWKLRDKDAAKLDIHLATVGDFLGV